MHPALLAAATSLCLAAPAAGSKRAHTAAAAPAKPQPAAPTRAASPERRHRSAAELLQKVRALNDELEFEELVPVAQELVGRSDAALELKQEGFLLLAAAYVILGDPVAAELPFTQLLRVAPTFELPPSVEPKVALVFKKVQAEERELARQLEQVRRRARIDGIEIRGEPPGAPVGGQPLVFRYELVDPLADVRAFRVAYHRPGEEAFSSLALAKGPDGAWSGALPADVTVNASGLELSYYLETSDPLGPLRRVGAPEAPLTLQISPGRLEAPWHGPLPRWPFFAGGALTVAAAAVSGTLYFGYRSAQDDYRAYVGSPGLISLDLVDQKRVDGIVAAQRLTAALITAGVVAAITVVLGVLADWSAPGGDR